jgi:hypothetical protein
MKSPAAKAGSFALAAVTGALLFSHATFAHAKPDIKRKGGQWGITLGGSACVPGRAKCTREHVTDGGISIDGKTQPSFGLGAELGYRFNPYVFLGANYNFGLFNTQYEVTGQSGYKRAYQNSIYAVVRPTLPLWRFDFGLGLGPGFSRQTFVLENKDKDYSQGFSFLISPTIDIFVSRRIFLGVKLDLLLNGHGKTCRVRGNLTTCEKTAVRDLAPVHQMIFGLHVGGTFL